MYDLTRPSSEWNLDYWVEKINRHEQSNDCCLLAFVGNKSDGLRAGDESRIEKGEEYARTLDSPHYAMSALSSDNVNHILMAILEERKNRGQQQRKK